MGIAVTAHTLIPHRHPISQRMHGVVRPARHQLQRTDPRPTRWVLVAPIVVMTATMLGFLADSGGACWRLIEILHP